MATPTIAPVSKEAAWRRGYRVVKELPQLHATLQLTSEQFEAERTQFRDDNGVDCRTARPGTLCFDRCYPNGVHVVGYCDQSKGCKTMTGRCNPNA